MCGGVREVLRRPVGKSSSCIYIYLYVFYPYIYIPFDNSDDVMRHGPYLKDLHNLFPHSYIYFDYAYAFPG